MLIQVDFYKSTGKWYAGGKVEIDKLAHEDGILENIINRQTMLTHVIDMYVVVNDIPESSNDPNYRTTYSRLYSLEDVLIANKERKAKK